MLEVRDEELALDVHEGANPVAPPLGDDLNRASDSDAPRVGVRRKREHAATRGERLKHGVGLTLFLCVGTSNWMHQEDKVRRADLRMLIRRHGRDRRQSIDRRRPDKVNACGVFAKPCDARGALLARWEVDMRELRDCMTHRLVGDTFRTIAAMNVRNADTADRCSARGGKRLDAIAEHDDDGGSEPLANRGERRDSATERGGVCHSTRLARALHLEPMHAMAA